MDETGFDRFARALARPANRRGVLALAGGFVASRMRGAGAAPAAAPAAQAGPSTCGAAGDVCTMLLGCCSGLTCVTSAINVNYGVCVTGGDGGTVASGTGLISPFSDTLEQEIGTLTVPETTTTVDPEAEREERKLKREARKNRKESRRTRRRNERDVRRDDQRDEKELRRGPKLDFRLDRAKTTTGEEKEPEVVVVRNNSDRSIFISEIHLLGNEGDNFWPSRTLGAGQSYRFLSGVSLETEVDSDETVWRNQYVCDEPGSDAGFVVVASHGSDYPNKDYIIRCDGSAEKVSGGNARRRNKRRKKSKHKQRRQKRNG